MFKKNDEVTCEFEHKSRRGIVVRGGSKTITVQLDDGRVEIKGHASLFQTAPRRAAFKDAPSAMDGYSVRKYKVNRSMSDETECFSADIISPTGAVINVYNRGRGGPDNHTSKTMVAVNKLYEDAKSWSKKNGGCYTHELAGLWLGWYQNSRPHHISAKSFLS